MLTRGQKPQPQISRDDEVDPFKVPSSIPSFNSKTNTKKSPHSREDFPNLTVQFISIPTSQLRTSLKLLSS